MGKEDIAPLQFYTCINSHRLQVNITFFKKQLQQLASVSAPKAEVQKTLN